MTSFHRNMAGAGAAIVLIFGALVLYAARVAPRMARDSHAALDAFYARCQQRDYAAARALCSRSLRSSLSEAQLARSWRDFEAKHGALQSWKVADDVSINAFGGSVCVFPPFVDYRHGVSGAKGSGTLIYIRMTPENGAWKVERFNVLR